MEYVSCVGKVLILVPTIVGDRAVWICNELFFKDFEARTRRVCKHDSVCLDLFVALFFAWNQLARRVGAYYSFLPYTVVGPQSSEFDLCLPF